jgi:ABC-2 type transport system permease protein
MLCMLTAGMAIFEALIVLIARASPPQTLFASEVSNAPGLFRALSGSNGGAPITTYPGLLGFGLVHPFWIALQLTAVASLAAAVMAADIEAGTIELVMARPLTRGRLLAERVAALAFTVVLLNATAVATLAIGIALSPQLHRAIPLSRLPVAGLAGLALAVSIAGPAIAVSAGGRRRSHVLGAAVAFGAIGFALNFIALAWHTAAPLRYVTPFHYYTPGNALARSHTPWSSLALLFAIGMAGVALAAWTVQRRDLAP